MVLGFILVLFSKRQITNLFGIALLSTGSCVFAENATLKSHKQSVANHLFTLSNDTDSCELIFTADGIETRLPLALSTPCYWVTKPDSTEVQLHSYPTQNVDHVFLIAGTKLDWDDEKKQYQKLPIDTYCSQYLQGITIIDGVVTVADKKMDAPNCVGQSVDEKVFHGVALHKNVETKEEEGLLNSIKKTFQQLFKQE